MESRDETVMMAEEAAVIDSIVSHQESTSLLTSNASMHFQFSDNHTKWGGDIGTNKSDWALAWGAFSNANHSSQLDCGSMTQQQFELWQLCQYWCEGILFAAVGSIGILGNLISVLILSTK